MSSFAELAALPAPGAAVFFEASLDNFATAIVVDGVTQRWSTVTGNFIVPIIGTPLVECVARITSVGRHQRSLSADGLSAASTLSLVLDNTDGGVDWMTKRETVQTTLLKARFRVVLALFDPANPTDTQSRALGIFSCLDLPTRDESRVFLELADDILAAAADIALAPSLKQWAETAASVDILDTAANFSTPSLAGGFQTYTGAGWGVPPNRPLPLAFGQAAIPLTPTVQKFAVSMPTTKVQMVLCCTTLALSPAPPDAALFSLQSSKPEVGLIGERPSGLLWAQLRRSQPVTSDGKTWRIWFVEFDLALMTRDGNVMNGILGGQFGAPGALGATPGASGAFDFQAFWQAFLDATGTIYANAFPLSSHTYPPAFSLDGAQVDFATTAADIAKDLLAQYARAGVSVETASFSAVSAATPANRANAYVADIGLLSTRRLEPTVVGEAGQLRGILRGLASSGQFDLTVLPSGAVRCIANTATYESYVNASGLNLPRLDEERVVADSLRLRTPSQGQRWAPYNRVFLDLPAGRQGPFDHPANLAAWGRPFSRIIDASFAQPTGALADVFTNTGATGFDVIEQQFNVESRVRPVLSFRCGPEAVTLELGDYFVMSVTRGGATSLPDTYVDAIWRVEALNYLHETGQAEVEAVWVSTVAEEIPFLLDDETLITRADSATYNGGGVTASVLDDNVVTFSAGNLVAAGVAAGDILVLKDGDLNEGMTEFAHNRGIRIVSVNSGVELIVSDTVRAVGGTIAVATWTILRGHTTYPTAVSDPSNYADGSRMYGKAAEGKVDGVYSNSDIANQLTSG